jgi:N-acyl-D-amino-acid deacylase
MKKIPCFLCILYILSIPLSLSAQTADILIKNGKILDGTGNSWHYGDIAVQNGKIVAMGKLGKWNAAKNIDATGLIVACAHAY